MTDKSNSVEKIKERRQQELRGMIEQSKITKIKNHLEGVDDLNSPCSNIDNKDSQPVSKSLDISQYRVQEKKSNSVEKIKERRQKELDEMMGKSQIKEIKYQIRSEDALRSSGNNFDSEKDRPMNRYSQNESITTNSVSKSKFLASFPENEAKSNSVEKIKERRQKELNEMMGKSQISEIRDRIRSEEALCLSENTFEQSNDKHLRKHDTNESIATSSVSKSKILASSQENEEKSNSAKTIKECRQKELDLMMEKSQIKKIKAEIKSEEATRSACKTSGDKFDVQIGKQEKLTETPHNNIIEFPIYKSTYSYKKEHKKELTIEKDEILSILEVHESGWWLVKNELGEKGFVPSNFLTAIKL